MSIEDRFLQVGETRIVLRRDDCPTVFVDQMTEFRVMNGNVYLSFASITQDGSGPFIADIVSRLRMDLVNAQVLRNILTNIIDEATKPADTSKAN